MSKLKELNEKFQTALGSAMEIRNKYEGKSENMTTEEEERYDKFLNEADGLKSQIQRLEKVDRLEKFSNEVLNRPLYPGIFKPEAEDAKLAGTHRAAYKHYLQGINKDYQRTAEFKAWEQAVSETKAYQADNPAGGGFAVPPQELIGEFLTLMKDLVFVRQMATIYTIPTAESLGVPAIDTDPSDSDWTSELATGNEETTAAIGKRELRPHPLAKSIKLSKKLLRQVPNFDTVILDRLAYKMAITEEKAFLTGTGANQPLGVFIADSNGISTSRDKTTAGASAIAGDDIIGVYYNLKAQYRQKAAWILRRAVVEAVRKLKGSDNNYLWQPGLNGYVAQGTALIGSQPETLMSRPIFESEYAPGTITTGLYTGILGDFSKYWIADALSMEIQVLYELYAASNQMGYIMRKETDGMPVLEEAFSRMKQA